MLGFGVWEIVVILLVALLVLGPDKLPDAARQIAKGLRELRRATGDLQASFHEAVYQDEDKRLTAFKNLPSVTQAPGAEPRDSAPPLATTGPNALPLPGAPAAASARAAPDAAAVPQAVITSKPASMRPEDAVPLPPPPPEPGEKDEP